MTNEENFDKSKLTIMRCECGIVYASTDCKTIFIRCRKCKRMHRIELELKIKEQS